MQPIFIPGNIPSLKNSKVWTGKYLVHNPTVTRWFAHIGHRHKKGEPCANLGCVWNAEKRNFVYPIQGMKYPLKVGLRFVRDSKRRFDYINAAQVVQDMMVEHGWLPDDNADYLVPVFLPYEYDKTNPGVYIELVH